MNASLRFALLTIGIVVGGAVFAADTPGDKVAADARPSLTAVVPASPPLGKTVRLEFKLVSSASSNSFVVLCAERDYSFHYDRNNAGTEMTADIAGKVLSLDDKGRLLVTFKVALHMGRQNDDVGGAVAASGSSYVTLGTAKELAAFDGYTVKLTATVEE